MIRWLTFRKGRAGSDVADPGRVGVGFRRIAALAVPALAVMAAEPLYLLVDTAVVGHLGRVPLAALALAGGVLAAVAGLSTTVFAYGTTGRAARRYGVGDRAAAVVEGVQTSWLALGVGLLMAAVAQVGAAPLVRVLAGGPGEVADGAALWLRIAGIGVPGLLLAIAGNGWMRGVQDTRRPLAYVLGANVLAAALCPILVYPVGLGLVGSALANVAAQTVSGALFVRALVVERVSLRPRGELIRQQLGTNRDLLIRGAAFQACFIPAAAVTARFGAAPLGAYQIVLQLWMYCVLALEGIGIAAQSLIGADLGAGRAGQARGTALRVAVLGGACGLALAVVIGAGVTVLPGLFTTDRAVLDQTMVAWPWFVGVLPLAGVVFALDGVLIGAGDIGYLRNLTAASALGGFLPAVCLTYALHLGLGGIWAGLTLFIVLRLAGLAARLATGRWAVVGATR